MGNTIWKHTAIKIAGQHYQYNASIAGGHYLRCAVLRAGIHSINTEMFEFTTTCSHKRAPILPHPPTQTILLPLCHALTYNWVRRQRWPSLTGSGGRQAVCFCLSCVTSHHHRHIMVMRPGLCDWLAVWSAGVQYCSVLSRGGGFICSIPSAW